MKDKRFLIIGSNSFSGSNCVTQLLEKGFRVWGVSRSIEPNLIFLPYKWKSKNKNQDLYSKNFTFRKIDLNFDLNDLLNLIDDKEITHIINFASQGMVAESWKKPLDWYQTNLISQVSLHDELRKRKYIEKYVHFTTPEVYGDTKKDWIVENKQFAPSTPYAVSRASCDLHLESFFKAYNFPVVFTRAANVFGPGQQLYRIVPRSILSCINGKKLDLHGGGLSERSFIHISDTIEATIKIALEAEPGNSYHISTNESISIKGLVQKICNLMEVDYEVIVNITEDRLGKDQSYLLNSDKLREQFNWTEKYNLNDGLIDTIKWVKENNKIMTKLSWDYFHKA